MDALSFVLDLLYHNPVFTSSLLAAVFLGVVALGSGWARLDFAPLLKPGGFFTVLAGSSFAVVLLFLERGLEGGILPPGLARLPLYVLALSYGPSAGLLGGLCFLAFSTLSMALLPGDTVVLLELIVLGWLALQPHPGTSRWLGPLYALAAYALAWVTAGVALLGWTQGGVGAAALGRALAPGLPGLLFTAFLLSLSPRLYRAIAPLEDATLPVMPSLAGLRRSLAKLRRG